MAERDQVIKQLLSAGGAPVFHFDLVGGRVPHKWWRDSDLAEIPMESVDGYDPNDTLRLLRGLLNHAENPAIAPVMGEALLIISRSLLMVPSMVPELIGDTLGPVENDNFFVECLGIAESLEAQITQLVDGEGLFAHQGDDSAAWKSILQLQASGVPGNLQYAYIGFIATSYTRIITKSAENVSRTMERACKNFTSLFKVSVPQLAPWFSSAPLKTLKLALTPQKPVVKWFVASMALAHHRVIESREDRGVIDAAAFIAFTLIGMPLLGFADRLLAVLGTTWDAFVKQAAHPLLNTSWFRVLEALAAYVHPAGTRRDEALAAMKFPEAIPADSIYWRVCRVLSDNYMSGLSSQAHENAMYLMMRVHDAMSQNKIGDGYRALNTTIRKADLDVVASQLMKTFGALVLSEPTLTGDAVAKAIKSIGNTTPAAPVGTVGVAPVAVSQQGTSFGLPSVPPPPAGQTATTDASMDLEFE